MGCRAENRTTPPTLGVHTIGQMATLPRESLIRSFGSLGEHLHQLSQGRDDRPVIPIGTKSVSNETTFDKDTDDRDLLIRTIHELADEVGRRLRHDNFRARKVTLKLRYEDFSTHTKQTSLERPTQSNEEIGRIAIALFNKFPLNRKIRLIGVGSGELTHEEHDSSQLDLFASPRKDEKLGHTLDEIREKFGHDSLRRGSQLLRKNKGSNRNEA